MELTCINTDWTDGKTGRCGGKVRGHGDWIKDVMSGKFHKTSEHQESDFAAAGDRETHWAKSIYRTRARI